ncbi:MAG TPA: DNA internalization-related competence protein ComEC/Rec2, partial [Negativicutes bacterium]|nr:DNA internalization-related competence protein ComEC/Rec2 [Negativicutes bacterium]
VETKHYMAAYALSLFCGILAASILMPGRLIILVSLALSIIAACLNRKNGQRVKIILLLTVFLAGMLDYAHGLGSSDWLEAFGDKEVAAECLIIDSPVKRGGSLQYTAVLHWTSSEGKNYNKRERVFLKTKSKQIFQFGDKVRVDGALSGISGIRNPGDFDYRMYYKSRGIGGMITAAKIKLLESGSAGFAETLLYRSREKVRDTINKALPPGEAAMLVGIITGDKTDIAEDTRASYVKTGLSHILSVSGLHVGFLMLLVTYILKPLKLGDKAQGFVIMLTAAYYVLMIGAPLPAVRSLAMLAVLLMGKALGRGYDLLASVSFAALLILLFKPLAIYDPGFVISFGAMYSIAVLYPASYNLLRRAPSGIRGSLALSISVWLGLAPVLAWYFNYISIISLVINMAAVPLAFLITLAGFCGVLVGMVSSAAAVYVFSVDYYLIKLLTFMTVKAAALPFAGFSIPTLPPYGYIIYYLGLGLLYASTVTAYVRIYFGRLVSGYMVIVAAAFLIYSFPSQEMKLVFLDVGQGDSCCIITPGKQVVLVDGGGSSGSGEFYYDVGGKITLPALLHQGVWRIDTVVVSHMHDDHMEGLLKVLEGLPVKRIIIPRVSAGEGNISKHSRELLELCTRKGVRIYRLGKGDSIGLDGGVRLDFLLPGSVAMEDENQNSLVGLLTYGRFKTLLSGDIGSIMEACLAQEAIASSILKVPHHGSATSSSAEFLGAVKPYISIVSVGNNNFGHPAPETVKRLDAYSGKVYRTDEAGAVTITTDGETLKVKPVR